MFNSLWSLKLRQPYTSHWDAMRIRWRYIVKVLICKLHGVERVLVIDILWRAIFHCFVKAQWKSPLFSEASPEFPTLQTDVSSPAALSLLFSWFSLVLKEQMCCLVEQSFILFYSCYCTCRRKHPYLIVLIVPHNIQPSILLTVSAQQIFK